MHFTRLLILTFIILFFFHIIIPNFFFLYKIYYVFSSKRRYTWRYIRVTGGENCSTNVQYNTNIYRFIYNNVILTVKTSNSRPFLSVWNRGWFFDWPHDPNHRRMWPKWCCVASVWGTTRVSLSSYSRQTRGPVLEISISFFANYVARIIFILNTHRYILHIYIYRSPLGPSNILISGLVSIK